MKDRKRKAPVASGAIQKKIHKVSINNNQKNCNMNDIFFTSLVKYKERR